MGSDSGAAIQCKRLIARVPLVSDTKSARGSKPNGRLGSVHESRQPFTGRRTAKISGENATSKHV
jgi:hypothetical protein